MIAGLHFLALLSPGPDFFLIVRSALVNGFYIALAISGVAVLLWDLGLARAAGHPPVVKRFMAHVRKVERATGVVLLSLAAGIDWSR